MACMFSKNGELWPLLPQLAPSRPLCPAFLAHEAHSWNRPAATQGRVRGRAARQQDLGTCGGHDPVSQSVLATQAAAHVLAAGLQKHTRSTEGASAAVELDTAEAARILVSRVHQGCRLLLAEGQHRQCLELLQASADLILNEPLPDEDLVTQLLLGLITHTNTEAALAALPLVTPSAGAYEAAIKAFAAQGGLRGVREVMKAASLHSLLKGPGSRNVWLAAVAAYGQLGKPEEARKAFKEMRQAGAYRPIDTHAANVFLHALVEETPLKVFVRYRQLVAEGLKPDTSTFNVLIKCCMRGKDAQRAELAYSWLQEARLPADEATFNGLIKAFSYAGDFERVLGVRARMEQAGFEPTPRIWGSLLVACGAAGQLEHAGVLWDQLKQRHKELVAEAAALASPWSPRDDPSIGNNIDGIPSSSNSSSSSRSGRGDPSTGNSVDNIPSSSSSSSSRSGRGDQASSAILSVNGDEANVQQSGRDTAGLGAEAHVPPLADGSAVAAGAPAAPGAAAGCAAGLLTTSVFNAMMTALVTGYQGERALQVFEELRSTPGLSPDLRSYNLAIKGCESPPTRVLRPQQLEQALALKGEMLARGLLPDIITYGTLIHLCAQAKQGRLALQLYVEMQQRGVKPNKTVVGILFRALGAAGMVDDCMRIFRKILWAPARLRPNRATFRQLLQALKENGALSEALRVYQGMRKVGYAPHNQEFTELISAAAEQALRQEDTALREQVLALAKVKSCREVDLHGMSSTEARAAVLCVLSLAQQHYALQQQHHQQQQECDGSHASTATSSSPGMADNVHDIVIITGAGRNSAAGEAVLPGVVLKLLREELGIGVDYGSMHSSVGVSTGTSNSASGAGPSGGSTSLNGSSGSSSVNGSSGSSKLNGSGQTALHDYQEEPQGAATTAATPASAAADAGKANAGRIVISKAVLLHWLEGRGGRKSTKSHSSGASSPAAQLAAS